MSPIDTSGDTSSLDRWWRTEAGERYWLEVSERGDDLGADLNAPILNEVGRPFWSYDLVDEVQEGDVVLHYDRGEHAVVGWSAAVGRSWRDDVVWAARGTYARGRNIQPHERPGRRLALQGPFPLSRPLHLARIRSVQPHLDAVRAGRPYFPFELGKRPTRPIQGYLFKLPAAFLPLFEELSEVPQGIGPATVAQGEGDHGSAAARPSFRARNEDVRSKRAEPWSRDPSEVDRGLSSHARIERQVAEIAASLGWDAKAYGRNDPVFDLLLERADGTGPSVVVEAKSTTASNEEKQLRLALGQVLRYRQLLSSTGRDVIGMIAVERSPTDERWLSLCHEAGVRLVWPATVRDELRQLT